MNFRLISFKVLLIIVFSGLSSCSDKDENTDVANEKFIIKAADLSFLPEIEASGTVLLNQSGQAEDMLTTLKNAGMNTVRIRLWKNPEYSYSGFSAVRAFAEKVKAKGLKVWLSVHYSDTWADPGNQSMPDAWKNLNFNILNDSIYNYTSKIVREINPDYIQIGNEINNGFMWPAGSISQPSNFKTMLQSGLKAVRDNKPGCKIIIHFAGIDKATEFYANLQNLDYDIIGLSYYPIWHGKSLNALETTLNNLGQQFNKQVLIAETSYPFTLDWNDWTNNVIGLEDQLLDGYPATPEGQKAFLHKIKQISSATDLSIGFAYWGGEWVAFKGTQAINGSSWENQAFYDFNLKALPVLDAYKDAFLPE